MKNRIIVWFSCGAASAVTAKLAVEKYPHEDVHIVYCNTLATEHEDNLRFMQEVSRWIGKEIEIISSTKYQTVDEVFMKRRYMAGVNGAPCTVEMKKLPRYLYQMPGDLHLFGFTNEKRELKRIADYERDNPDIDVEWILRDRGFTKEMCKQVLRDAGIQIPMMYKLGFKNNNCIGCVKSTSPAYWDRTRTLFPEVFARRCEQSREIGARLVELGEKRIFLDELPREGFRDTMPEPEIDCGVLCYNAAREDRIVDLEGKQ
jgi:hypothetical protein